MGVACILFFLSLSIVLYGTACFAVVNLNRVRQYACFGTGAIANLQFQSVAEMSVGQTFVMIPCKTLALVERDPNRTELRESHLVVKALTVTTKIKSEHYLKTSYKCFLGKSSFASETSAKI